jgi:hypothetical protein
MFMSNPPASGQVSALQTPFANVRHWSTSKPSVPFPSV